MLSKSDKNRAPMSAASHIAEVRSAALALVLREESRVYSRMIAYENIASQIGASRSWLRQFIGGAPHVSLSYVVGMNIMERYHQLCGHFDDLNARVQHATNEINLDAADLVCRMVGSKETSPTLSTSLENADRE